MDTLNWLSLVIAPPRTGTRQFLRKLKLGKSNLAVSAAWEMDRAGTTKRKRLEENIGAANVELTPDDLREIESAASKITVHAARYPEYLEKRTGL